MNKKMNVLNVQLDDYTAKEAMMAATEYMKTEPVNTIEVVTVDVLMRVAQDTALKENLEHLDLVLAGDEAILEAVGDVGKKKLQETRNQVFLKMLMRYFHKNHLKLFLLADGEEELAELEDYITAHYGGIQVVGAAGVPNDETADDMIVNQINGAELETGCVLSALSSPKQEAFIVRCKPALNARLWLGVGKEMIPGQKKDGWRESVKEFIEKKILKREIEKDKKKKA